MPSRLQEFANLVEIKIHNCSIAEWGDDAAVAAQTNPMLQILYVTMTNMSEIPDGLLSPDFPLSLTDVEFCVTNLTALPLDLLEKWTTVLFFYLELSPGLAEFPPALYHRNTIILFLSLSSNSISALSDDLFVGYKYVFLLLSGNPPAQLPEQIRSTSAMNALSIAFTDIADVPASWTSAAPERIQSAIDTGFLLSASSTPLCDNLTGDRSPPDGPAVLLLSFSDVLVAQRAVAQRLRLLLQRRTAAHRQSLGHLRCFSLSLGLWVTCV